MLAWPMAHPGTTLILDDMAARRAAEGLGLSIMGTLGVVLAARAAGAIIVARPGRVCRPCLGAGTTGDRGIIDDYPAQLLA